MDPTANLKEQLELAKLFASDEPWTADNVADAIHLAELVIALNDWISRGGFLPRQWKEAKHNGLSNL